MADHRKKKKYDDTKHGRFNAADAGQGATQSCNKNNKLSRGMYSRAPPPAVLQKGPQARPIPGDAVAQPPRLHRLPQGHGLRQSPQTGTREDLEKQKEMKPSAGNDTKNNNSWLLAQHTISPHDFHLDLCRTISRDFNLRSAARLVGTEALSERGRQTRAP